MPRQPRIADLHCHYPMHLLADRSPEAIADRKRCSGRWFWLDGARAGTVRLYAHVQDYKRWSAGWRVSFDGLERAHSRLVLAVHYDPVYELIVVPMLQRPRAGAFRALLCELDCMQRDLAHHDRGGTRHAVVTTAEELDRATANGQMAFVHCVEGGFFVGRDPQEIARQVAQLAERGVAYITLAHLFYRGIASNAPAIPRLSDAAYNRMFHQRVRGLSALGDAAVRAMHEHRVLVDITHMDAAALDDTFALLDELDPEHETPVIASHAGCRIGTLAYMLDDVTIGRIAQRNGVIGLILAQDELLDGLPPGGEGIASTFEALRRHINHIRCVTGSYDNICIGSDLDGFTKPTVSGIEASEDLAVLDLWLRDQYPEDVAEAILYDNAERVVRWALTGR